MADADVKKNTLSTIFGTVASKVAIQGDLSSPNTCQRLMNKVHCKQIGRSLLVYIDDCFIISDTWEDHMRDTEELIATTQENQLKLARHK